MTLKTISIAGSSRTMPVSSPAAVVIELTALGIGRCARDAGSFERRRIRDGNVTVDTLKDRRMTVRDSIELLARRQNLLRPNGVVPSAALQPLARRGNLRGTLDAIEHLLKRLASRQIDRELDAARLAQVRVRIVDAWHGEGAAEVDELRLRPLRLEQ